MAGPSKRPRSAHDVDGSEEEVETESASSSLRQNATKRIKVALRRDARDSTALSDTDEEHDVTHYDDLLENDDDADLDADVECSLRQDTDGEADQGDGEVDELKATQIVKKQMSRYKDNIPMEEGIIEEVYCQNFMCHSKLRIRLGPLINFIVGHNGSGKSAVLTALQLCLGGKAAATNRGTSLKSLIKVGTDSAMLSVKIKNQGENAYKHDLYGNSIIVERHFNRAGASSFKLKNMHNKEISKKKADLDDVLDYFALQLDNPINVLTQDNARQFLSNSTPAEKYKFFIQGTNLKTLDSDYKIFEEQLDTMNEKLRMREEDIKVLLERRNRAEQRKKRSERTARLYAQIRSLQRQCAWSQVEEQEVILESRKADVRLQEEAVHTEEEKADTVDARFEAADQAHEAAKRALDSLHQQLQPATDAHAAEKVKFDDNKDLVLAAKGEQRNIRETIKSQKNEATRLASEIELEEARLSEAGGAEHARRVAEHNDLKQRIADAKQAEQDHSGRLPALQDAERLADDELKEAAVEKDGAAKRVSAAQASVKDHDRKQGGKYEGFKPNMAKLCQAIAAETRWNTRPIGPIGLHIQLLKPGWSHVLEKTFGGALDSFIVMNRDDQRIFSQIAKRVGCQAGVYVESAEAIEVKNEPEAGVDTILRVLSIDHPTVRRNLVLTTFIEQVVLIADSQKAQDYMMKKPKNVKATLAFNSTRHPGGVRYDLSRSGQNRSSPVGAWNGGTRMKTDHEEQKQILQQQVLDLTVEADAAAQRYRTMQMQLEKARQAITRHKREGVSLKAGRQRLEAEADDVQAEIEKSQPEDGKLQELQNQFRIAKADQQKAEEQLQDSFDNNVKLDDVAKELKLRLDTAQEELNLVQQRVDQAEAKINRTEEHRQTVLLEKNEMHDNVNTAKEHVARLTEKVTEQEERVNQFVTGASSICERVAVESGMTYEALDKRLTALVEQHNAEQRKQGGTEEELLRAFADAEKIYLDAKEQKKDLDGIAKVLQETLKERHRRWKLFRQYISCRARINFQYLLSERSFRGRVNLNHDTKELDIKVEPDMARASDAGRQAKTLSGGEKSFSTICLLLSIWEAMGSPIRCLDEFDVFMDSVNRKQSMDLMIQTARRSVGRQFILITPQSMQNIAYADDVQIHKMSDPERGQQTLPFNAQQP